MIKGYKTMIYPTKEQSDKIIKFCNASRFAYNWAIALEECTKLVYAVILSGLLWTID